MGDTQYPIRIRFVRIHPLGKNELMNICRINNYDYDKKDKHIKLVHRILREEYYEEYDNFINFCEIDKNELEDRMKELLLKTTNILKKILKNYNLTTNGRKSYLVDRIIKYEYYNKIENLEEQKRKHLYEIEKELKYYPEINYIENDYENHYNIDMIYKPVEFFNIYEYVKHMENLRILGKYNLINEHLDNLSDTWFNIVRTVLINIGWNFNIDYDSVILDIVNTKYVEKEDNMEIIDKIEEYNYNMKNEIKCIVCQCEIEENEKCKKLKCGHIFHSECINNWLKRSLECPMCRIVIT